MKKEKDNEIEKREQEMVKRMGWSVQGVWNDMLDLTKRREPKSRDYISFSDLGKSCWDRYMKMTGVPETNPYEDRVLRVFSAGDEFHGLLKNVFRAAGIFMNSQDEEGAGWSVIEPTDKTLKVLGKYDVLAGGKPDYLSAKQACGIMGLSDFVTARTLLLVERLLEKYPGGMPEKLYEIKSINSLAFWNKKDYLQEAYPWHVLQLYGYLKANNLKEGRLIYISKDDLMTAEFPVYYPTPRLEEEFNRDVEEMSGYVKRGEEPPKPDYVVFNKKKKIKFQREKKPYAIAGCWEANWQVTRSNWFSKMTGFKTPEEWEASIKGELADRNAGIKAEYIEKNFNKVIK